MNIQSTAKINKNEKLSVIKRVEGIKIFIALVIIIFIQLQDTTGVDCMLLLCTHLRMN